MKKIIIFILLCLSLFAINKEKKETVLKDFNAFKNNYSSRNAQETIKYFTPNSIKLYDDLLILAIENNKNKKIGFLESMIIMNLQNKLSKDEMKKMSGKDIILWSINEGIDSFENFNALPIYDVYEKDEFVYVVVGYEKENIPIQMEYFDKLWKVDFPYLYEYINKSFESFLGQDQFNSDMFLEDESAFDYEENLYYDNSLQVPRHKRIKREY